MAKSDSSAFITKAQLKHFNKNYGYEKVVYFGNRYNVEIICPIHGSFWQKANNHLNGATCPHCDNDSRKYSNDNFLTKANIIHGNFYKYPEPYKSSKKKLEIVCPIHGSFCQTPALHLFGSGCPDCAYVVRGLKSRNTHEEFIKRSNRKHNNVYEYPEEYKGSNNKVKIICHKHGEFFQEPSMHMWGQGCPRCGVNNISRSEKQWLDSLNISNLQTQKKIFYTEKKYYIVDGYDPDTNTVYEYNGKFFHGHPDTGSPNEPHPFGGTYGKRYSDTFLREEILKGLGYNVVSLWD